MNLFYAELLDMMGGGFQQEEGQWIDLGSKNFLYVFALAQSLQKKACRGTLIGIEMDPHRRYHNYYRRSDYAKAYCAMAEGFYGETLNIQYEGADWLKWQPEVRAKGIFCFYPFVFRELHQSWGLPISGYNPLGFYQKIFEQSEQALFFHQGIDELQASLELLKELRVELVRIQRMPTSPWVDLSLPTYGILAQTPKVSVKDLTAS
jgi:hypothetical protein